MSAMYLGTNIHYSATDQKPLCSFSGKICRQRRLNGYGLCLRHILEDPSAPYKRCINLAKNGLQCSNIIPQSRKTDYCSSHMQAHAAANLPFQPPTSAGFALQSLAKSQQSTNGLPDNPTSGSSGVKGQTGVAGQKSNGPRLKKKAARGSGGNSGFSLTSEDPYAFPSDPDPPKARKPPVNFSNMPHPFPNLSQALANLASGAKHGQPQVYESSSSRADNTSSIARFFPELVEKLDIGKSNKLKGDSPPKAKISCLSSLSNNKSSRTMNRLQTKIAQNKIKDKLKKSTIAHSSSNSSQSSGSPNSVKPSQSCGSTDRNMSASSTTSSVDLDSETKPKNSKKSHISSTPTTVSNHKAPSAKSRSSRTKSRSKNASARSNTADAAATVVGGQFPGVENSLQCTLINPWTHPGVGTSPGKGDVSGYGPVVSGYDPVVSGYGPVVSPLFSGSSSVVTVPSIVSYGSPEPVVSRTGSSMSQPVCKTASSTHNTTSSYGVPVAHGVLSNSGVVGGLSNVPSGFNINPNMTMPQGLRNNISLSEPFTSPPRMPSNLSLPPNVAISPSSMRPSIPPPMNLLAPNIAPVKDDAELLRCYTRVTHGQMSAKPPAAVPSGVDLQKNTVDSCSVSDANLMEICSNPILSTAPISDCTSVAPSCIKVRQYKETYPFDYVRQRVKRHSAMTIYNLHEKRKKNNLNLFPMGIDSSDDDESDVEEVLPCQQEWLLSSSDSEKDEEDIIDDPLLANIRHTKQALLHAKLRRRFTQAQKTYTGNTCVHANRARDLSTLVTAARDDPEATAESLRLVLHEADPPGTRLPGQVLLARRPCLCKTDGDEVCGVAGVPFTNQCGKHIMYNIEQQLYAYCTAKFSDNTQCCIPVFDIKHELPLCPEHAAKAENYQKNLEASRPKKPRKKTKPSALTRPPKKGKKKKNQRKNKPTREMSPVMVNSNSSALLTTDEMSADDNTDLTSDLLVPSSPESKDPLENDLGNDLEESFSPGTIDKHLELPLGEHDLNEVLNKLPDDAFELFAGRNGDFSVNSKVEEEAAAFEHVLAETSKKLQASESLGHVTSDVNHSIAMMMAEHSSMMGNHGHLVDDHGNLISDQGHEDDLTKEIADSILQQNLSPTGSIVDDLGHDNISALASSLSVSDLRNISQVLNATLINPSCTGDLPVTTYSHSTMPPSILDHGQGRHQHILSSSTLENGSNLYPYTQMVPVMGGVATSSGDVHHQLDSSRQFISAAHEPPSIQETASYVSQQPIPVNGASSSQSIAQILAALTAGTKQFTNTTTPAQTPDMRVNTGLQHTTTPAQTPDMRVNTGLQHLPPVVNLDSFLQVPVEGSMSTTVPTMSVNNIHSLQMPMSNPAGLVGNNQYITVPTSQAIPLTQQTLSLGPKPTQTSLPNGLITFPASTPQQFTIGGSGAPLGLKLTCPLQTLVPVGLLGSTLPQGLPGNMMAAPPTMLANHGQPMVAMTNATQLIPHPAATFHQSSMSNT